MPHCLMCGVLLSGLNCTILPLCMPHHSGPVTSRAPVGTVQRTLRQYIQPSQAASEAPFTHVIRLITIYSRGRVKALLGILFCKLLGSYAISTAAIGVESIGRPPGRFTPSPIGQGCAHALGLSNRHPAANSRTFPRSDVVRT